MSARSTQRAAAAARWLEQDDKRPMRWALAGTALLFAVLFVVAWPKGAPVEYDGPVVFVAPTEYYIPPVKDPPPPPPERQVMEQVKKIALPDPTPEKPEPIIQPIVEPPPEQIPTNARILTGAPRMPPPRAPAAGPIAEGTLGLIAPRKVKAPAPVYPRAAISAKAEGVVVIQAVIGRDGLVKDARVVEGLGYGLDEAALSAVRQWVFTVGQLEGKAVEVLLRVKVDFALE